MEDKMERMILILQHILQKHSWFTLASVVLFAALSEANSKPSCQKECGNLAALYDFGIGQGIGSCSMGQYWYYINSSTCCCPSTSFLEEDNLVVVQLSPTQVRVVNSVAYSCNTIKTGDILMLHSSTANAAMNLISTGTKYTTSDLAVIHMGYESFGLTNNHRSSGGSGCCNSFTSNGIKSLMPDPEAYSIGNITLVTMLIFWCTQSSRLIFPILMVGNISGGQSYSFVLDSNITNSRGFFNKQLRSRYRQRIGALTRPSITDTQSKLEFHVGFSKANQEYNYHRKIVRGYIRHIKVFPVKLTLGLGVCCSFLFFGIFSSVKKHKFINLKAKIFQKNGGLLLEEHIASHGSIKIFTAEELNMVNQSFGPGESETEGLLPDSLMVAIKKKVVAEDQIQCFINEIITLTEINHENVVKFLGCCLEIESPMLVYEHACNGTLFDYIHHTNEKSLLPWHILLKIASESAAALAYLHFSADSSKPMIIHGNVKSSNILVTDCFMAKVSGFEPSRSVPINESQISTLVQRTLGYLDPEYLHTGQLTDKSDVYSFGVVLLEILTGEMPICFDRPENLRIITSYFVLSVERNGLFQIVVPQLVTEGNKEQIRAVAELAKSCLKLSGLERPTMEEVAGELKRLCGTYST